MSISPMQEFCRRSALSVSHSICTRTAELRDALAIHRLIDSMTFDGTLLPRTYLEICENIDTFVVAYDEDDFLGCASLHIYGQHMAEIRSTVVRPELRGLGAGGMLIESLLAQARLRRIAALCLFTRVPGFFAQFGFCAVDRHTIPDKINRDCRNCNRHSCCDETAMLLGYLSPATNLVQILPGIPI